MRADPTPGEVPHVADAATVTARTLLGVSTSMKPPPGRDGRSAARSLLTTALGRLRLIGCDAVLLDLREHPLPWFDGRLPEDYCDPAVDLFHHCVANAGAVLLSLGAYWSGVSGAFKNVVDVLCGPAYDLQAPGRTVFTGRPVGLLVVGADRLSARQGTAQASAIMHSVGAVMPWPPVQVENIRSGGDDVRSAYAELLTMAAQLAQPPRQGTAGSRR